jgi:hypothetical protein
VARYPYTDEQGNLLYWGVRFVNADGSKTFKQCRPDGKGREIWNLDGVRRVLYRLPEVREAIANGKLICIAEGEADVEALEYHGYTATTNAMGAKKWRDEYSQVLKDATDIVIFGDNDDDGRAHAALVSRSLQAVGVTPRVAQLEGLPEKGDIRDWLKRHSQEELDRVVAEAPLAREEHLPGESDGGESNNPWSHIKSAPVLLAEPDTPFEGLAKDLLAPGAITIVSAPKGLGKTQVALNLAVALATGGIFRGEPVQPVRVLLLDRDNPEAVLKQRVRNWGAIVADNLDVLTRQHAPDLKDREAWSQFPLASYAVLIIDAVGSFTEGITEKEGKLTTEVLATLLDMARRGIAILLLMNVTKDGLTFKGREEWVDRVDIHYEVRDATGFSPSGKPDWWLELPPAGEAAWADRAARRRGKVTFRLAFIPNKFRLGMEPDPFCLELHLPPEGLWTLADVTETLIMAGEEAAQAAVKAKQERHRKAADALVDLVRSRGATGKPLNKTEAEDFLREEGLGRNEARELFTHYDGTRWRISAGKGKGAPQILLPCSGGEND